MILRNFKLQRKTSHSVLYLGTSYIILKVSGKTREGKQELLGLRKGEKKSRKEWERYGGKGKRKEGSSWNKRSPQWLIRHKKIIIIKQNQMKTELFLHFPLIFVFFVQVLSWIMIHGCAKHNKNCNVFT